MFLGREDHLCSHVKCAHLKVVVLTTQYPVTVRSRTTLVFGRNLTNTLSLCSKIVLLLRGERVQEWS